MWREKTGPVCEIGRSRSEEQTRLEILELGLRELLKLLLYQSPVDYWQVKVWHRWVEQCGCCGGLIDM